MDISRTPCSTNEKRADPDAFGRSSDDETPDAKNPHAPDGFSASAPWGSPSSASLSSVPASWNDLNDLPLSPRSDLIPGGTCAWVRMKIRRGGYNDPLRGWYGGYATLNKNASGGVMLACEASVLSAPYRDRRVPFYIGLHSPTGPAYAALGRNFLRSILNSAAGFSEDDPSPAALKARHIQRFEELAGLCFLARIEAERGIDGKRRNTIRTAVTPDMVGWFPKPSSVRLASSAHLASSVPGSSPSSSVSSNDNDDV